MYSTSNLLNYILFAVSLGLFLTSVISYIYQQRKIKRKQIQLNIELERSSTQLQREISTLENPQKKEQQQQEQQQTSNRGTGAMDRFSF
jgi:hypothetical protein